MSSIYISSTHNFLPYTSFIRTRLSSVHDFLPYTSSLDIDNNIYGLFLESIVGLCHHLISIDVELVGSRTAGSTSATATLLMKNLSIYHPVYYKHLQNNSDSQISTD